MKIFIYSHSPSAPSGYGQQVKQLSKILQKKFSHDVYVVAVDYHNSPTTQYGIPVLPTKAGLISSPDSLYYWAHEKQPNVILQLFDAWTLGKSWITEDFPVICYNPVDCYPIARRHKLGQTGSVAQLAMSKHALKCFQEEKFTNPIYLPHCYSKEIFYPSQNKEACRKALNLPKNYFLVGLIGTNITHRKNIPGQLSAFKMFNNQYPDSRLVLHTEPQETISTSFDIYHYMNTLNLHGKVLLVNPSDIRHKNVNDEKMWLFYNSIDVLMHASLGEGFGVSIIEAQACGTPVIVANSSAMPDVAGNGGVTINDGIRVADSGTNSWWFQPSHNDIAEALYYFYTDNITKDLIAKRAILNAEKYEWDKWENTWEDIFQTYAM